MSEFESMPKPYLDLAIAVVEQAAEDFREDYAVYLETGMKTGRLMEVEHWLRYGDGKLYSFGKGELILQMLKDEFDAPEPKERILQHDSKITYNGKTQTMEEWADEIGLSVTLLYNRFYRGWSVEEALTIPRGGKREQRY